MIVKSLFFVLASTSFHPTTLVTQEIPLISSIEVKDENGKKIGFLRDTTDFLSNNNPRKERFTLFIPNDTSQCSYVFKEPVPEFPEMQQNKELP